MNQNPKTKSLKPKVKDPSVIIFGVMRRLLLLTGLILAGCSSPSSSPDNSKTNSSVSSLTQDDLGRAIKLSKTPQRVISLAPGVTETIFALGAGDKLIARDQSADFPPEAKKLPVVADFNGPFFEKVVAQRPDFLIQQGETYDAARVELWQRKCGTPVALLQPKSIKEVQNGIEKIASWLGVPEKAESIIQAFPPAAKPDKTTVFFEIGRQPLWTMGSDTFIGDALTHLGYRNVANIRGYKAFSVESLAKANPDFYIVTSAKPDKAKTLRELRAIPALRNLKCIKQGQIVVVPADWILRPGPRLAQGLREIQKQIGK